MQFSIIIPTFNRAHLISRAIESVLAQDFSEWEMIIVDDGSTDNTGDVVRVYSDVDQRIQYHYKDNEGAAAARNFGCSLGNGKYFTFLDSDDEYLAGHLSLRAEMISAEPAIELIHGNVEVIGNKMIADKFDLTKLISIDDCIVGGTFFIRRDLFKRLSGFVDIPYADDNDFFIRAEEAGAFIRKIEIPTYKYYRLEENSISNIVTKGGIDSIVSLRGGL